MVFTIDAPVAYVYLGFSAYGSVGRLRQYHCARPSGNHTVTSLYIINTSFVRKLLFGKHLMNINYAGSRGGAILRIMYLVGSDPQKNAKKKR